MLAVEDCAHMSREELATSQIFADAFSFFLHVERLHCDLTMKNNMRQQRQVLFYLLSLSLVLKRSDCFVIHPRINGPVSTKINFKRRPTPWMRASVCVSDEGVENPPKKRKSLVVTAWVHVVTIFIIVNYRQQTCWPAFLVRIPFQTLSLLHAISAMLFAGSIMTTTLLEWIVVTSRDRAVNIFWFDQAPRVEKWVVLPALSVSIVSGVAQAFFNYGSLKLAPRHIKTSLHLLLLFGIWWGVTDRKTQGKAQIAVSGVWGKGIPRVLRQRRVANIISCLFLLALYVIMVLKPGYSI
jgi:hypothetical protein